MREALIADANRDEYRICRWRAEFSDPATERAFQSHVQPFVTRQLRVVLLVWMGLELLFAIPDYLAIGATAPFFYLLAYRMAVAAALVVLFAAVSPRTDIPRISLPVTLVIMAALSGFMLFFVYRSDALYLVIAVLMLQLAAGLLLIPIRLVMLVLSGVYGVLLTLGTRTVMGATAANLASLFVLLMLPIGVGTVTAMRLNILQRRQFSLVARAEKARLDMEGEMKQRLRLEGTLREMAATDPLTGLYNRREYEMLFRHEMERARRIGRSFSLLIVDLDHFKRVNDSHGHAAGDVVLRMTAGICRSSLRAMDIIGRLGGDEFVVLLPETTVDEATSIADRLLRQLSASDLDVGAASLRVTATAGVTELLEADSDVDIVIHRADEALYRGKDAGRNRVEVGRGSAPRTAHPGV